MKHLSELLNAEFGNSLTAKRAQVRNEILVRGDEVQAELAKGWSAAAIWKVLIKHKGNLLQLQNLRRSCTSFAAPNRQNRAEHAKKTKRVHLRSNTK
jgi:hypothetical protein